MKKAILELHGKPVPVLIQDARHYVTEMTGNVNFTTPDPPLADITAKALALETAYEAAKAGNHAKVAETHALTKDLKHLLSFLSVYVNMIAKGDVQIILSSGMKASKDVEHSGVMPAPADVRLANGTNEGQVEARWNKVVNARSYEIDYYEAGATPPAQVAGQPTQTVAGINLGMNLENIPWQHAGTSTSTKFEITGLSSGNRILVRISAVNTEGKGTWSDPATMVVP